MLRRHLVQAAGLTAIALAMPLAQRAGQHLQDRPDPADDRPVRPPPAARSRPPRKLCMAQNGDTVAGKKVQLIVKDDAGRARRHQRIAQELVVNDKVDVLAGFGITPLGAGRRADRHPVEDAAVVMAAATSSITEASPYIVRTSFTLPQASVAMADWAPKNGIKTVVTLVADYGPGIDAEKFFDERVPAQRRQGAREAARAAAQPGLRAVPAEGARRQARRAVRLRALGRGRGRDEAVRRARHGQGRHQADRHRRRDRRRPAQRHGRRRARRGHLAPLLGGAPVGDEQEVRRGASRSRQQGHAAELHGRRRLRRHARDLRGARRRPRARAAATRCWPR